MGCKPENYFSSENQNFPRKKNDIFYYFAQSIDCEHTLEPPRRCNSNKYPQSMFWTKITRIGIPRHTLALLYKSGA